MDPYRSYMYFLWFETGKIQSGTQMDEIKSDGGSLLVFSAVVETPGGTSSDICVS